MSGYHQQRDIDLSPREREVLQLMAKGLTNGQIAERLDIAFDTAKSHVSAIISKLGVDTREEAVRAWREEQRPAARFSRMARGLVAAIGMGKVAAGGAAVATMALAVGIGWGMAGGNADSPALTRETEAVPAAERGGAIPIASVEHDGKGYTVGVLPLGGELRYYMDTPATRWRPATAGIDAQNPKARLLVATLGEEPLLQTIRGSLCGGPIFGSTDRNDAVAVEVVVGGTVANRVPLVAAPPELHVDWRFWIAYLELEDATFVRLVDAAGNRIGESAYLGRPLLTDSDPDPAWHSEPC